MAGWMLAEVGRQPWIVYGLMRTSDAVSPVPASSVGLSLLAFIVIYTALGILDVYLLIKYARKGPKADTTGSVGADDTTGALSDNAGA